MFLTISVLAANSKKLQFNVHAVFGRGRAWDNKRVSLRVLWIVKSSRTWLSCATNAHPKAVFWNKQRKKLSGRELANLGESADPGSPGKHPLKCDVSYPQQQCECSPFPSNRHHQSNGNCLEGKRENYQVCSVQYCVQQLYTVNCTHIWTELTVLWIGFCLTGPISLCLDSFFLFCVWLYIACMCSTVTWWGGPGGIEAWSFDHYFLQCFDTVGWVIWPIWPIMCLVGR